MWTKRPIWLAWILLYIVLRVSGIIAFSYNIRRSRFEPSLFALIYSCLVVLTFCVFHPTCTSLYMSRIVAAYDDYIIYQTSDYYFKLGSIAFVCVYLEQILRRKQLVKLLNDSLEVLEQSRNLHVANTSLFTLVSATFVINITFSSLAVLNQTYVLDEDEQDELFLLGLITVIPYFFMSFFGVIWVLVTSLVVHVNAKINFGIKSLILNENANHYAMKLMIDLYYKIFDLLCRISRMSSLLVVVSQMKAFLGIASLLYYLPSHIVNSYLSHFPLQPEFFVELISNFMVYAHLIIHAVIGFMIIRESRETTILMNDLKTDDGNKDLIEFALFAAHNRLEIKIFDMVPINLESLFMAATSIMGYVIFLVQYRLSTEV